MVDWSLIHCALLQVMIKAVIMAPLLPIPAPLQTISLSAGQPPPRDNLLPLLPNPHQVVVMGAPFEFHPPPIVGTVPQGQGGGHLPGLNHGKEEELVLLHSRGTIMGLVGEGEGPTRSVFVRIEVASRMLAVFEFGFLCYIILEAVIAGEVGVV